MQKNDKRYTDLDFQGYKALAMACDSGTSLPLDPTEGQWFLHIDLGTYFLKQYQDSAWVTIAGFFGTPGRLIQWGPGGNTLVDSTIVPPASNVLTLTNAAASTLALNITAGKTLTLTAADNYTLTIPATGTAGLLEIANQWTNANQITVATATTNGLILKTSDNNATNSLLEVQSSGSLKLVKIGATGRLSIANTTAAHTGSAYLNVNDNSGATDLVDVRWANSRTLYINNNGYVAITPRGTLNQVALAVSSTINPAGATVTWWGHDEGYTWTAIPAGNKNLFTSRLTTLVNATSLSTTGLNVYVQDFDMATGSAFSSAMGTYTGFRVYTELSGSSTITNLVFFDVGTKVSPKTNTVTNAYGFIIRDIDYGATLNYAFRTNKGLVTLGDQTAITGWQDLTQFQVTGHTTQTNPVAHLIDNTAATNAVRNVLKLETQSTGTAANGLGAGLLFAIETATAGTIQSAGRVYSYAIDNANATRKYATVISAFDTAERIGIEVRANGISADNVLRGNTWFEGEGFGLPYGSIGNDDLSIVVAVSVANTYYAVGTGVPVGQINLVTFADSTLTVALAGRYLVNWSLSLSAGNNDHLEGAVMVNSTPQGSTASSAHTPGAGDEVGVGGTGILDLAANDVVKLCVENESDTDDITVHTASLSLVMIGGT